MKATVTITKTFAFYNDAEASLTDEQLIAQIREDIDGFLAGATWTVEREKA